MKASLQLRMSQHLTLTPQLQQSIRLLQLSTLELQQELEQALLENPMLERLDDPMGATVSVSGDGLLRSEPLRPEWDQATAPEGESNIDYGDTAPAELLQYAISDAESGWDSGMSGREERDDDDFGPQLAEQQTSLSEHLLEQLRLSYCDKAMAAQVAWLIDSLDENGYLPATALEQVAEELNAWVPSSEDDVRCALRLLQSFDPPGVGARSPSECLSLQIQQHPDRDSTIGQLAVRLCQSHLELLAARDWGRLIKVLQCSEDELRLARELILELDPHPGARFASSQASPVVPDVIVRRVGSQWRALLNPDIMPRLRVNDDYVRWLRAQRGQATELQGQLQEARWLIRNVQQRFETIQRVSQAIVDRQRNFFQHGAVAMRPLVLREIADILGLHESTISRVTTQKFMLTPFGTFELKYFFGSHVATDSGGAASSTAIRALLAQFIASEDPRKPLSDSELTQKMSEHGIVVARRTIAKYRDILKIPPVGQRRTL